MCTFNLRIGEHIRIPSLPKMKVKSNGSAIINHLRFCSHSPSFESLLVLTRGKFFFNRAERKPTDYKRQI